MQHADARRRRSHPLARRAPRRSTRHAAVERRRRRTSLRRRVARHGDALPQPLRREVREHSTRAAEMIGIAVRDEQRVERADAAGPQRGREHARADVEAAAAERRAAGIDQQRPARPASRAASTPPARRRTSSSAAASALARAPADAQPVTIHRQRRVPSHHDSDRARARCGAGASRDSSAASAR